MNHNVGRITFGPATSHEDRIRVQEAMRELQQGAYTLKREDPLDAPHACSCIGPQPGETKCPCRLRGESRQGMQMIRDGVVINGVEYDLVPRRRAKSRA